LTLLPDNADVRSVEFKINLLAPAVGDHLEAVGSVLRSGRTLTVCRLEVFAVQRSRSLVAAGQQTLIRANTTKDGGVGVTPSAEPA
jgi:acyl-coenzyme A thioesterase PaaI-like protein